MATQTLNAGQASSQTHVKPMSEYEFRVWNAMAEMDEAKLNRYLQHYIYKNKGIFKIRFGSPTHILLSGLPRSRHEDEQHPLIKKEAFRIISYLCRHGVKSAFLSVTWFPLLTAGFYSICIETSSFESITDYP